MDNLKNIKTEFKQIHGNLYEIVMYLLAITVVGILLTIINQCPWFTDLDVALKRVLIDAFPASMSATVTDSFS